MEWISPGFSSGVSILISGVIDFFTLSGESKERLFTTTILFTIPGEMFLIPHCVCRMQCHCRSGKLLNT